METKNWPYNAVGQVENVTVAREMAEKEDKIREFAKKFPIGNKIIIKHGEKRAENIAERARLEKNLKEKLSGEITDLFLIKDSDDFMEIRCMINGHDIQLHFSYVPYQFHSCYFGYLKVYSVDNIPQVSLKEGVSQLSEEKYIKPSLFKIEVDGQKVDTDYGREIVKKYWLVIYDKFGKDLYLTLEKASNIIKKRGHEWEMKFLKGFEVKDDILNDE